MTVFGRDIMAMALANNGVNVQALLDAREALKGAPGATAFTWRASCKWQTGTYSKTDVSGFFGLGQEQSHKTTTSFEADHPEIEQSQIGDDLDEMGLGDEVRAAAGLQMGGGNPGQRIGPEAEQQDISDRGRRTSGRLADPQLQERAGPGQHDQRRRSQQERDDQQAAPAHQPCVLDRR